jgi:hypothetical protein
LIALSLGLGAVLALVWRRPAPDRLPDPPALVMQMREVARLETLDVTLYKKVSFEPDVRPSDSFWKDLGAWVKTSIRPTHGKAIVFAHVHVGLSLKQLTPEHLRVDGTRVEVVLPPLETRVELLPGETEVVNSNLDSAETAQLFELARNAFEQEVSADSALQAKARTSSERALRGLLLSLGFRDVRFVERVQAAAGTN